MGFCYFVIFKFIYMNLFNKILKLFVLYYFIRVMEGLNGIIGMKKFVNCNSYLVKSDDNDYG